MSNPFTALSNIYTEDILRAEDSRNEIIFYNRNHFKVVVDGKVYEYSNTIERTEDRWPSIWHFIEISHERKSLDFDWSTEQVPSPQDIIKWVICGCPSVKEVICKVCGSGYPSGLTHIIMEQYYNMWIKEQEAKEIINRNNPGIPTEL